jgi:hypothetical protein
MLRKLTIIVAVVIASLAIVSSTLAVRPGGDGDGSGSTAQVTVTRTAYTALVGTRSHPEAGAASAPILDTLPGATVHRPGFQP